MKSFFFSAFLLLNVFCFAQSVWKPQPTAIQTRWAKQVTPTSVLPEYPRPQMVRKNWTNLNGLWEYSIVNNYSKNEEGKGQILVPFPLESSLSGVQKRLQGHQSLVYKKNFQKPAVKTGDHVLLHFGAVDYDATVFINGKELANHKGGYQFFTVDITSALEDGQNEIIVRVIDPTEGENPHGKQSNTPEGIFYTPSSGIWQTVWMEVVPAVYVESFKLTPDIDQNSLHIELNTEGEGDIIAKAIVKDNGKIIATQNVNASADIKIPNAKYWSPDAPFLYDLTIQLTQNGKITDEVNSYFGMRKIEIKKDDKGVDRIFLNNKYTYNLGVLDQGFWPDGLYTAPTDAALKFDVEAIKAMGFNTIRKHIKIEPARWYYHCDKLGMLVWQDMVNPGNLEAPNGKPQFEKEIKENIEQLYNYPCITTWVLFNEKWGSYDQERLTKWIKQLDPTRLLNGHSGEMLYVDDALRSASPNAWVAADMNDVHSYPWPRNAPAENNKAQILGEFGGIAVAVKNHLWNPAKAGFGYGNVVNPRKMAGNYTAMTDSLVKLEKSGLSGSIYTQPYDVEEEQNGLLTYDREISKIAITEIRKINARLWPTTKNYALVTKSATAKPADTASAEYLALLSKYKSGKRDSTFLRTLIMQAQMENDHDRAAALVSDYMHSLKDPLSDSAIVFITKYTTSIKSPSFNFLIKNADKIKGERSRAIAKSTIQNLIYKEEVRPIMSMTNPDWDKSEAIIKKYPVIDGELVRGLSVIYFLNAIGSNRPNATRNLVIAASRYDSLYNSGSYNDWAWTLFNATDDRYELTKAAQWAKKNVERTPNTDGRYAGIVDTYANLLYKLGQKEEGMEWEKKALAIEPENFEFKRALELMQQDKPTWGL